MQRKKTFFFTLFFVFVFALATAFGQQTVNYASAGGLVTDPAGASVSGASVSARQVETNQTRAEPHLLPSTSWKRPPDAGLQFPSEFILDSSTLLRRGML
jgi:hypothetical protein